MNTQAKRNGSCLRFIVVAVVCCAAAAVEGVSEAPDDPDRISSISAEEPNDLRWDLTERLAVAWDSVELSVKLSKSLADEGAKSPAIKRTLTISGELQVFDTNDLIGIDANCPVAFEVLGGDGDVLPLAAAPQAGGRRYQELDYYFPVWDPSRETWLQRAKPCEFLLCLNLDPNQPAPSSLSLLRGYVYVLYAEDIIEVNVPFEASDEIIEATPDLEIVVSKAQFKCCAWEYTTWVRSKNGSVQGLGDPLSSEDVVADYVILETQLVRQGYVPSPVEQEITGNSFEVVRCSGQFTRGGARPETIRHIIAVSPWEAKVPFVFTDIPVPGFEP